MRKWGLSVVLALSFLAYYRITTPDYIGDTTRYARDAIGQVPGIETQFWEFGHLLWRPWGYVGHSLLGARYASKFGDTPVQAVVRFLIQTNLIFSVGTLVLMLMVLRKVGGDWIALAVAFAMSCSNAFINYSHSGAPYIPALFFSALTFWLLTMSAELLSRGRVYALSAGVSFAIACALWFPYSISGAGMLLLLWLWPARDPARMNMERPVRQELARDFLLTLTLSTLLIVAAGASAKGIENTDQLWRWIKESDNGWSQSMTAIRVVTGLPRAIWNFGADTILLKRWLFSDPYNSVRISTLVFGLGAKLGVFYIGVAAALWVLWRERREILFILVGAGLPVLLFAIVVFEPSSPERFLPVFPFVFAAFAVAVETARRHVVASSCVIVLLSSSVVFNLAQNRQPAQTRLAETRRRIQALNNKVKDGALVFVVTFNDDLYRLPAVDPLDRSLATTHFEVTDSVEIASQRMTHWRDEFAMLTKERWSRNGEVWVSERLLANRPEASWLWVEGDDRRIHWPDLPAAFNRLEYDSKVLAGDDGFFRVAHNEPNRALLAEGFGAKTAEASLGARRGTETREQSLSIHVQ